MADNESPLGRKWKTWGGVLGGIIVVLIVGLILFPLFQGDGEDKKDSTGTLPGASPSAQAGKGDDSEDEAASSPDADDPSNSSEPNGSGDCPSLSGENGLPVDAPKTEWVADKTGIYLPTSRDFGPAKTEGAFWRCYSHTTTGAVFAAPALMTAFENGGQEEAAEASSNRSQVFQEQQAAEMGNGDFPRISGYKVVSSSEKKATIEYLVISEDGPAAISISVIWSSQHGDWRLDVTQGAPDVKVGVEKDSYTSWGDD